MWTALLFIMVNALVSWLKFFDITLLYTSHANILKQLVTVEDSVKKAKYF